MASTPPIAASARAIAPEGQPETSSGSQYQSVLVLDVPDVGGARLEVTRANDGKLVESCLVELSVRRPAGGAVVGFSTVQMGVETDDAERVVVE